jgi:hypothetical protein
VPAAALIGGRTSDLPDRPDVPHAPDRPEPSDRPAEIVVETL